MGLGTRRYRIYPFKVKPPSHIATWSGWPSDVLATLHKWNHGAGHRLTFQRMSGTFKCECGEFCLSHEHGAAVLDGIPICDDCLIKRVRNA